MDDDFQKRVAEALRNPQNLGELENADAVGTAGSAACGDMLRLWIKFKEQGGKRVVDRATFQSFGCETAIAVASLATEMIRGKTAEEVLAMSNEDLSQGLGPLPPVKIHCSQLVETALHSALRPQPQPAPPVALPATHSPSLLENFSQSNNSSGKKLKIVLLDADTEND
jgi:NifU-like protein involved in Fe-S cluster formation